MTASGLERARVDLGPRSYSVEVRSSAGSEEFAAWVRSTLDQSWAGRGCRSALVVADARIDALARRHVDALRSAGIEPHLALIPSGEASKSLRQASLLYERLIEFKADRHTVVVAVGGGVIGDLAGFVAATFARGLPLIMIPTTLLSQVDSSVGGKVGVNLPRAKNIVGAFHQPAGVWIETESLDTLPPREFRCGLAEVVKYGVILDAAFFAFLEASVAAIEARDPATIRRIVARSCELKAEVVTRDEREETGLRAVLNFGHTIAHAIEAVAGYDGDVPHGEAVAIGMVAESRLAERIGWIGPDATRRLESLLARLGLPVEVPDLGADPLIDAMGRDKKNRGGRIRFVLPREIGRVELTDLPTEADVRAALHPSL